MTHPTFLWTVLIAAGPWLAVELPARPDVTRNAPPPPPEWLLAEMDRLVTPEGQAWITDNSAYMSEEEAWEQYGIEWHWEADSTAITGRLFGLVGGEDRATFWDMRLSWEEDRQVARIWQKHTSSGAVGDGAMRATGNGIETEGIQTFTSPTGATTRVRHLSTTTEDTHDTRSFDWVDGEWQPRRRYVWTKQPLRAGAPAQPALAEAHPGGPDAPEHAVAPQRLLVLQR